MARGYDFFFTGNREAARALVEGILVSQGFALRPQASGTLVASRGSMAMTVAFGGLAGKRMHFSFTVDFVDEADRLVARLTRDTGAGALKGGTLGAAKTGRAFDEVANVLREAAGASGQLAGSDERA